MTLISYDSTATAAQFQAALRLVTYRNSSSAPSTTDRSVTYQISDGSGTGTISTAITTSIKITATNNPPTLSAASALIYTERQTTTPAINAAIVVADVDNTTLSSATVTVSLNYSAAQDVLAFVGTAATGNIVGNFDSSTGVLTLTSAGSTATALQFQTAIRLVTYRNTSSNPSTAARSISFQVSDGISWSTPVTSIISIVSLNDTPIVAGTSSTSYVEKQSATVINSTITISDADNSTLASATVKISTNYSSTQDVLGFVPSAGTGNIIGSFNPGTGVLTLISPGGTATVSQFQTALQSVTYFNSSANPTALTRSITYQVSDGAILSNSVICSITIAAVDDRPVLDLASALIYPNDQNPAIVNSVITVTDADNATLAFATVTISNNYVPIQDVLEFVGNTKTGNIIGVFSTATGVLTLTSAGATATVAQFQAALRLVTYRNSSATPSTSARSLDFQVFDGTLSSNALTSLVTIKVGGAIPVVSGSSTLTYSSTQTPAVINSSIIVSDSDSTTLAFATVKITGFVAAEDVLGFTGDLTTGNITATYNAAKGTLTLISVGAQATTAQFQSALRRVTYFNRSSTPSTVSRSVTYQISDGSNLSAVTTANTSKIMIQL